MTRPTPSRPEARAYRLEDLVVGMSVHYTTRVTRKDVAAFARLCGDVSPLHVDRDFGAASAFGGNIVHGMLASSHFSTLAGVYLPGENAVLAGMNLSYTSPIPVGSQVTFSARIARISRPQGSITLNLLAFVDGDVCIRGEAAVKVTR
jgi:3-hydroxybutyryl-CoA dehydratase